MTLIGLWLLLCSTVLAAERRYALVIGADRGDVSETPLRYAEADARRFADMLTTLGGVSPSDITTLRTPSADEVRSALALIHARIATEAPDDETLLYFYYSGHADAMALHLDGTRLPLAELKDAIDDAPADVRLLLLDACRAGAITRLKGAAAVAPFDIAVEDDLDGMAILTAAAADEDAQESEALRGGIFTHHLIAGLQGAADASGDHAVTLTEAYQYAQARTIMTTSRAPVVQHPNFDYNIRGAGDLTLTRLEGSRRAGLLRLESGGDYVLFDPKDSDVVFEFTVPDGGEIVAPVGDYLLRRRAPDRIEQASVSVAAAQTTAVPQATLHALPYGQTARRGDTTAQRSALGVVLGSSYGSSVLQGADQITTFGGGLRLDRPEATAIVRARAGGLNLGGEDARVLLDLDAAGFKLWDPTPWLAVGAGARTGAARINDTAVGGEPIWLWHFDVAPRVELQPSPRTSIGIEGGAGAYIHRSDALGMIPSSDQNINAEVVFYLSVDVSLFVF